MSACMALQKIFLCSKLRDFHLFDLSVCQGHELPLINRIPYFGSFTFLKAQALVIHFPPTPKPCSTELPTPILHHLGKGGKERERMPPQNAWASLAAQTLKNPLAVQKTWVQSLGQEDPLEKGMAIHFSILAWGIPWTEEPGRLQSTGSQRVGYH